MYPNNAAGRLLDLFERAKGAAGNKVAVEVWASVLDVDGAGASRARKVVRHLTWRASRSASYGRKPSAQAPRTVISIMLTKPKGF